MKFDFEIDVTSILEKDGYWMANKKLAKQVGLVATVILSDLISKRKYFNERSQLDNEGMFYNTSENITDDLNISRYEKDKNEEILLSHGYIEKKLKGLPATTHYRINDEKIFYFLVSGKIEKRSDRVKRESLEKKKKKEENLNDNDGESSLMNMSKLGSLPSANLIDEGEQQIIIKNKNKDNNNKIIKDSETSKVIPFKNLHQKFISELISNCNKEVSYNPINKVKEQQAISELMFKQVQPTEIANLFNALSVIKSKGIKDRYINSLPYTIESVWKRADDIMGIYGNIESSENYGRTSDTMFGIELEEM